MKRFKEYEPDQMLLLPPSLKEWLPEEHLANFISDIVDELDLAEVYRVYESNGGGQPAYEPRMMVKLLLYGYCVGVPSSRKIENKTYEDVGFRVLSANQHPDHDTISEFRRRHLKKLSLLFVQVLKLCRKSRMVKLGHVCLDSTKIKANASKHKAMSYVRMCEKEKELEEKVRKLLEEAEAVDKEEDRKYGKGKRGDELPEELRFHKSRLEKIREAKKALEEEEREKSSDGDKKGVPDKRQRNFTDPESKIMKDGSTKSFIQGYNCEIAVDAEAQVIVAADVSQEAIDKRQFKPVIEKVKENTGKIPEEVSADAGYFSEENIIYATQEGIDAYVSPDKIKHGEKQPLIKGRISKSLSIKERMRRKLRTKLGKERYSKRKETAEPVFGQIKERRGFRQFLLRGLEKVKAEWQVICLTHNLLKLYRYAYVPANA
ncbi:MAG TPA: IS1182 family transposase [Thermodesulfovibrionales bacterium]|nr:IS1182 family transposase [Thermodesulfovibrionales bacterium]